MTAIRPKTRTLPPIHSSAAIAATFSRRLRALVDRMNASVLWWVRAAYRANAPEIAQDATPASILRAAIRRITKRWTTKFDDAAQKMAAWFATATNKRSTDAMRTILKDAGISVEFQRTAAMRDIEQATVTNAVSLIKTIPQKHFAQIEQSLMRSVQTGRDLASMTRDLKTIAGTTDRQIARIVRTTNNQATAAFARARQLECGITEALWLHSSAGKKPRPSHVEMNGKPYDVAKGMWDKDEREWVLPGQLINCRCLCRPIVKGFL